MSRQGNIAQMKEQIKTSDKKLNGQKQSIRCRILLVRMLRKLSEDLNSIKKIQGLLVKMAT